MDRTILLNLFSIVTQTGLPIQTITGLLLDTTVHLQVHMLPGRHTNNIQLCSLWWKPNTWHLPKSAKHGQRAIQWLQQLDFTVNTTKLYSNSLSACAIVKNLFHHSCTKHIEIWHHHIWNTVQNSIINVSSAPTRDNVANTLTKPFTHNRHQFLCMKLGLVNSSIMGGCCETDALEQSL